MRNRIRDLFNKHNITYQKQKEDGGENENTGKSGKVTVCAHTIFEDMQKAYAIDSQWIRMCLFPSRRMQ